MTNLPPSSRRNMERGLRELRAWLQAARAERRASTDPAERRRLLLLIDDLEFLTFRLERVLHPSNSEGDK